jgi:hypothetical protein
MTVERPGVPAPLDDPLSYPGRRPTAPFRLRGDELAPLAGALPAGGHAVLAIGSNACPEQLAAKFRGRPCDPEVVGFPVLVAGLQVRPSAHLGRAGYWPFAPAALDASSGPAVLCLLDADQLAVLDRTEPNYDRIELDRPGARISGAPPEVVRGPVGLYASKHGVVDDARLPAWADPPPTQVALLSAVLPLLRRAAALPPEVVDARTLSRALRGERGLAEHLTGVLGRTMRVRPDGLR